MIDNYFLKRTSCRNFSPVKIEEDELKNIIYQAAKAPTCGNMQLYSVIITENECNKKKLASYHFNQPAASSAPLILTICADFNRFTKWCEINNADAGYNNFHSFIMALTDAVIFAQQIVTIAEQKGLGTCYLGSVTYNAKEISELLELPDLVIPCVSLAIGYPAQPGEATLRLPIDAIMHKEKYRKDSEKDIQAFFEVHDKNTENLKYIQENGKANLAQVFAEIRYPRGSNESLSRKFGNLLREKRFMK